MKRGRRRWLFRARTGSRDANHAAITKALTKLSFFFIDCSGVGGGVLDLLVYDRLNNPAWVELKTEKGRLTDSQRDFIAKLEARRIPWTCARTLDDVLAFVDAPGPG
jgi:hypothetical protein